MKTLNNVAIAGIGSYVPSRVLTNFDLEKMVDTSNEWIIERTGIRERRIAAPDEASSDLGTKASVGALEMANMSPQDIDLIIVGTTTPDHLFPNTACLIQKKLGCREVGAFDVFAACPGFIYILDIAYQYIATNRYQNVLIVAVEVLSRIVNYKDRNTCVLLGDGAGAVVLKKTPGADQFLYTKIGATGSLSDYIIQPAGISRNPVTPQAVEQGLHYLWMDGRGVYKFAVNKMVELIQEALEKCSLRPQDVRYFIPHQVNMRILESACERLNLPMDKLVINIDKYGNTSAASIPLALDELVRNNKIERGDIIAMVSFGAGMTWGSAILRW